MVFVNVKKAGGALAHWTIFKTFFIPPTMNRANDYSRRTPIVKNCCNSDFVGSQLVLGQLPFQIAKQGNWPVRRRNWTQTR